MKVLSNCNENVRKLFKVMLTPSNVVEGICEIFNHDTESNDVINDNNQGDYESKQFLKGLFRL